MKLHEVIISLASNENQEANLAKAREQLTQLMADVHFTSAIWTKPYYNDHVQSSMFNVQSSMFNVQSSMFNGQCSMVNGQSKNYLNQLCKGTTAFGEGLLGEVLKETEKRIGRQHNEDGIVAIDLDLLEYDGQRHHLKDWNRDYVKNLLDEL